MDPREARELAQTLDLRVEFLRLSGLGIDDANAKLMEQAARAIRVLAAPVVTQGAEPPEDGTAWRIVKVGQVAPKEGGHGTWVETDHPAVVACMGSAPECQAGGCQLHNPNAAPAAQPSGWREIKCECGHSLEAHDGHTHQGRPGQIIREHTGCSQHCGCVAFWPALPPVVQTRPED